MNHVDPSPTSVAPDSHGQQHSISVYLRIWGLLFVFSTLLYLVDYFRVEGLIRWVLIVVLMTVKTGLIVSVSMHMIWERLALVYAILMPPLALLVLIVLMAAETHHTFGMRALFLY